MKPNQVPVRQHIGLAGCVTLVLHRHLIWWQHIKLAMLHQMVVLIIDNVELNVWLDELIFFWRSLVGDNK